MWLCAFCASIVYCVQKCLYLWCLAWRFEVPPSGMYTHWISEPLPPSGCQIFATRSGTELEAVIAPGHSVLSLCVLSNCHGNRESCNWIPFCSNWEGKFTITLYNISGPPPLSPPSQPERPTRWCHQVGWVLLPWQLVCRWVQADDTTVSPRDSLPPPPPSPSLSLPLFFCFTTSLFSPSLPPLSCLVLFYLSSSPFPSLLSHFTHDQCRKRLGCCQPALRFCLYKVGANGAGG